MMSIGAQRGETNAGEAHRGKALAQTCRVAAYLVALAVIVGPLALGSAYAQSAQEAARQRYAEGRALYDAGDYRGAIRAFEAADRLVPSPVLDYNIGLGYEQLGERAPAIEHFEAYLQRMPDASNRAAVQAKIDRLSGEVQEEARRAEEARQAEEVGSAAEPAAGVTEPAGAPAGLGQPVEPAAEDPASPPAVAESAYTGSVTDDPELARAAAIDVAAIRDQRAPLLPDASSVAGPRGPVAGSGAMARDKPAAEPAYKQWWFWAVVGVSAVILYDIMSDGTDGDGDTVAPPPTRGLMPGVPVIRF